MSDHEYNGNAFDEWLRTAARDYNEPPAPDREGMWRAVEAKRRECAARRNGFGRWKEWGIGLAAMLALAIGVGRWAGPAIDIAPDGIPRTSDRYHESGSAADYGEAGRAAPGPVDFDFMTAEHLSRTEAMLVIFRTAPQGEAVDPEVVRWARELLSTTRLIMDWSETEDPRLANLLTDLELVLAQIVQLPVSADAGERELVERSIDRAHVLRRLRSILPPPTRVARAS